MFPPAGFPHSGIRGSSGVCPSPRLIAAYRALHRLRVPRHPPLAFCRLTTASRQARHAQTCRVMLFNWSADPRLPALVADRIASRCCFAIYVPSHLHLSNSSVPGLTTGDTKNRLC